MARRSVTLDKAIEEFFTALEPEQLSEKSIDIKRRTLRVFQEVAGRKNRATRSLTDEDFDRCLRRLTTGCTEEENAARRRRGLAPRLGRRPISLNQDRTTLKQFVAFLKQRKWVGQDFNPLFRITASARSQGTAAPERIWHKRNVPVGEWEALLDAAATHHPRTRIVVAIGLHLGRRASETAFMQFKHLDLAGEEPRAELFNIKRGRPVDPTKMIINVDLVTELRQWTTWLEEHYGPVQPDWYVCPAKLHISKWGDRSDTRTAPVDPTRPMRSREVETDVKRALRAHGWTDEMLFGEGGHTLRRSHTIVVEDEGGVEAAMAAADHDDARTTYKYTGRRKGKKDLDKVMRNWRSTKPSAAVDVALDPKEIVKPAPAALVEEGRRLLEVTDAEHALEDLMDSTPAVKVPTQAAPPVQEQTSPDLASTIAALTEQLAALTKHLRAGASVPDETAGLLFNVSGHIEGIPGDLEMAEKVIDLASRRKTA